MSTTSTPQPIAGTLTEDAGESVTVTISVTRPDATVAAPVILTATSGSFTGSFTDTVPDQTTGNYIAAIHTDATAKYAAFDEKKTFTIAPALLSRNVSWHIGNSV